jgi:hypothetical protein
LRKCTLSASEIKIGFIADSCQFEGEKTGMTSGLVTTMCKQWHSQMVEIGEINWSVYRVYVIECQLPINSGANISQQVHFGTANIYFLPKYKVGAENYT